MRRVRILAIVPYEGLKEVVNEAARARDDVEVHSYVGDLSEGVRLAVAKQHDGYSAIISRSGTAEMIERVARIPVIGIQISVYDILRAVRTAQNYAGRFAIVDFPTLTDSARVLCDLMQYNTSILTLGSEEALGPYLERLKRQGYSLIIGGAVIAKAAKQHGFNAILVTSGRESVDAALSQAIRGDFVTQAMQSQSDMYRQMLDTSTTSIVAYAMSKDVLYSNTTPDGETAALDAALGRYVSSLRNKKELRLLKRFNQSYWNIYGRLLRRGEEDVAVFYCSPMTNADKLGQGAITYRNFDDTPLVNFTALNTESPLLQKTIANARRYGESTLPVLIHGQEGAGKDWMSYVINNSSPLREAPLAIVNCCFMNDRQWDTLFQSPNSPLCYANYTIYFKNMHCLTEQQGQTLETYLANTAIHKRNRLIFSYVPGRSASFDASSLLRYINNKIGTLTLAVPSLNEYTQDIPSLASLCLNELSLELGRQVVGFEPDALELLQEFHWEQNIEQFRRVMRELILLTDSAYINKKNAQQVLRAQRFQRVAFDRSQNLDGSLDEIISTVIRQVLEQEGMNQSKAARRLGISRSTLWRKLRPE